MKNKPTDGNAGAWQITEVLCLTIVPVGFHTPGTKKDQSQFNACATMPTGMAYLPETLNSRGRAEVSREVMSDPILFWTLCVVIAVNIIVVVFAFTSANREARRSGTFRSDEMIPPPRRGAL